MVPDKDLVLASVFVYPLLFVTKLNLRRRSKPSPIVCTAPYTRMTLLNLLIVCRDIVV